MSGDITRMAVCNRSGLATSRRLIARLLNETAATAGVAVAGAKPDIGIWIGPREWATFAAVVRKERPHMESDPNPFDYLEAVLSEAHARHRDDDPAVIILGALPVTASPGIDPAEEPTEVPL